MAFELPKLDYANDALAPVMSQETLDLHHGKHHQTYVTNLNNLVKDTDLADTSLEDIIKKNLFCLNYIQTPNGQLPLFNGATVSELTQIHQYLEKAKTKNINNENLGGLFKIKYKSHLIFIDIEKPPQKKFSNSYQSGPLSFEYFR